MRGPQKLEFYRRPDVYFIVDREGGLVSECNSLVGTVSVQTDQALAEYLDGKQGDAVQVSFQLAGEYSDVHIVCELQDGKAYIEFWTGFEFERMILPLKNEAYEMLVELSGINQEEERHELQAD